jgi:endonuclease/exonuclease/phosphatase family metal-dependent hydrolase
VKLITWNIQWGLGADGRVDLDRIVEHARRLADFDVLCVQEVSQGYPELAGCDGSDQFAALAALLPGYTAIDGVATDTAGGPTGRRRFGNMVFSRLPVGRVMRHLLPWPSDPKGPSMARVAIEATVEAPFGPLRVMTTHLEYYSATQRAAQVDRLRELHREAAADESASPPATTKNGPFAYLPRAAAAVLTGDFNFSFDAPEYTRIQAAFDDATPPWRDAWPLAHPQTVHAPTVGLYDKIQWPGPPLTIDFVFVSADLAARVRELRVDTASDASDHQPVLLELE